MACAGLDKERWPRQQWQWGGASARAAKLELRPLPTTMKGWRWWQAPLLLLPTIAMLLGCHSQHRRDCGRPKLEVPRPTVVHFESAESAPLCQPLPSMSPGVKSGLRTLVSRRDSGAICAFEWGTGSARRLAGPATSDTSRHTTRPWRRMVIRRCDAQPAPDDPPLRSGVCGPDQRNRQNRHSEATIRSCTYIATAVHVAAVLCTAVRSYSCTGPKL